MHHKCIIKPATALTLLPFQLSDSEKCERFYERNREVRGKSPTTMMKRPETYVLRLIRDLILHLKVNVRVMETA